MRVLLRAKMHGFSGWGIERLVGQLYDQSLSVAMTALTVLEEACELKVRAVFSPFWGYRQRPLKNEN
ncbi:hypothetical protein DPMN_057205 [Dreissena polymorpha]|uniref:Rapamycin-insensitive companion of mTOR domain-containing protein n=1 Tax=Dreissena polymorpha TaxID=45954 RepID=A0A9D4CV49_DREPO|nr:hypothetical protein DPMN_057205 [Dreissena polymorpha]